MLVMTDGSYLFVLLLSMHAIHVMDLEAQTYFRSEEASLREFQLCMSWTTSGVIEVPLLHTRQ